MPDPGRHRSVLIEADGGSRGNPGPAAYGAVLKDAETGEVIAEEGTTIGVASNNVAEYSGLIAGLRMAAELAPDADVEVRMDSKLVVEQMSGRWKVKHPAMKPLALEASRLAPSGTTYTWVPREQNKHADRLANEALDGKRSGVTVAGEDPYREPADEAESLIEEVEEPAAEPGITGTTTLVLVRHGVTEHTSSKRFSGGLGGANPGLSEEGRAQALATAEWLKERGIGVDTVVASPVRRTRETADIVAAALDLGVEEEPGFAEMEFGEWDGLTFVEVMEKDKDAFQAWVSDMAAAPPGGESFHAVEERVLAALTRLVAAHAGETLVVVSHVTPIKTLVAHALGAPLEAVFRMDLQPAAVSIVSFFPDHRTGERRGALKLYNALPAARTDGPL
ncbi:putative phosphoglycerate mutase [Nocardioides thalensis]|uniref:Putative phosphoglycerate mutase n=1 Tax=Nocardioides thalensis TaxID=1914755 RepID=A0A853C0C8_9ACTN|nr:putative phosphoglycerate mutase [Nocardioides thalensis]